MKAIIIGGGIGGLTAAIAKTTTPKRFMRPVLGCR
jgi:thioredoxin reductase